MTLPGGNPRPIETWPGFGSLGEFQALKNLSMFNSPTKPLEVFDGTETHTRGGGAELGIRGWGELACQMRSFSVRFQALPHSLCVLLAI